MATYKNGKCYANIEMGSPKMLKKIFDLIESYIQIADEADYSVLEIQILLADIFTQEEIDLFGFVEFMGNYFDE